MRGGERGPAGPEGGHLAAWGLAPTGRAGEKLSKAGLEPEASDHPCSSTLLD